MVDQIGHVNVQSCLLIIFKHRPISLQSSWLSAEQPIRFRLSVVYAALGISNTIEANSNVNMPYYRDNSVFWLFLVTIESYRCKWTITVLYKNWAYHAGKKLQSGHDMMIPWAVTEWTKSFFPNFSKTQNLHNHYINTANIQNLMQRPGSEFTNYIFLESFDFWISIIWEISKNILRVILI